MSEPDDRAHTQYLIMTDFRPPFRSVMQNMRDAHGMALHEVVSDLQLSVIMNYERAKLDAFGIHCKRLEDQEVAVLRLIISIAQEMACEQ